MIKKLLAGQINKFILTGTAGFIVDASILKLCIVYAHIDPIMGRLISFPCAVTVTWLLNRRYTYKVGALTKVKLLQEWGKYVAVNSFGAAINISVYTLIIYFVEIASVYPIATLGLASLIAMFFNYIGSTYLVFNNKYR